MLLGTFLCGHWDDWLKERYDLIKEKLGIAQESEIYWCFSANTVEQAVLNAMTSAASQPVKFILFETENYYKADKIRWVTLLEQENVPNDEELDAILSSDYDDTAEFIVTELPEKRVEISLDLSDLKDYFLCSDLTEWQKDCRDKIIRDSGTDKGPEEFIDELIKSYNDTVSETANYLETDWFPEDTNEQQKEFYKFFHAARAIFPEIILHRFYDFIRTIASDSKYESNTPKYQGLEHAALMDYYNAFETWSMNVPHVKDSLAHDGIILLYESIYTDIFDPISIQKVKPNEPCPCGSGKKYKKCCRNRKIDIPKIMSGE